MIGAKIVGNDFVNYLRAQSRTLILSKMAGPAFLGLFNKAESLSRLPNQLLMSPTMEPLFRAMSKAQGNLDQTKYLYYRAVTLLMAYTLPAYALLWWIAEPFITFVYGPKWIESGAPMSILTLAGPVVPTAPAGRQPHLHRLSRIDGQGRRVVPRSPSQPQRHGRARARRP